MGTLACLLSWVMAAILVYMDKEANKKDKAVKIKQDEGEGHEEDVDSLADYKVNCSQLF